MVCVTMSNAQLRIVVKSWSCHVHFVYVRHVVHVHVSCSHLVHAMPTRVHVSAAVVVQLRRPSKLDAPRALQRGGSLELHQGGQSSTYFLGKQT